MDTKSPLRSVYWRDALEWVIERLTLARLVVFTLFNLSLWLWFLATRSTPLPSVVACETRYTNEIARVNTAHSAVIGARDSSIRECQSEKQDFKTKFDMSKSSCEREKADLTTKFDYAKTFAAIVEKKCDADFRATLLLPRVNAVSEHVRGELANILIAYDAFQRSPLDQTNDNVVTDAISNAFALDNEGQAGSPDQHLWKIRNYMYSSGSAAGPASNFLELYLPHMNRSAEAIKSLFDSNKKSLYAFIGKELYQRSHMQFFVHALRNSYEVMMPTLESESTVSAVWQSSDAVDINKLKAACVLSKTENISKHTTGMSNAFTIKYAKEIGAVEEWLCGFWVRRTREKSAAMLFGVLTEIAQHYGDIAPTNK